MQEALSLSLSLSLSLPLSLSPSAPCSAVKIDQQTRAFSFFMPLTFTWISPGAAAAGSRLASLLRLNVCVSV